MKRKILLIFILVIFTSCEKSNHIKKIEVLTYLTNAHDFKTYSTIDNNGLTQTLFKSDISDFIDNYQSKINKSLIDSIYTLAKNKSNNDFGFKRSKNIMYDGYLKSIQISYENGEKLHFQYPYVDNGNRQFSLFQSILKKIRSDSLNGNRIFNDKPGHLYLKQEELSDLTFKEDSIKNRKY